MISPRAGVPPIITWAGQQCHSTYSISAGGAGLSLNGDSRLTPPRNSNNLSICGLSSMSRSAISMYSKPGNWCASMKKRSKSARYHLHEAEVKANAGLRPQIDVYLTEAEVQRAQLHLVDARNAEDDAEVAFDNALGLGGSSPNYQLVDVLTYSPVTEQLGSLVRDAMSLRPDMKALADQARAMGARITQYRSDYFPTVNGVAGYSAMGTGLPAVNNFDVGIVISWPIFNSFLTTHQIAEAQFQQRAIQSQMEDLRQRVLLQVKTAFLDWQASLQRITRAERTLAASRAELELAEKRYAAGLADIVELEDAQRSYTADDAAYTNSLYGFSIAKAAVDQATARSLSGS